MIVGRIYTTSSILKLKVNSTTVFSESPARARNTLESAYFTAVDALWLKSADNIYKISTMVNMCYKGVYSVKQHDISTELHSVPVYLAPDVFVVMWAVNVDSPSAALILLERLHVDMLQKLLCRKRPSATPFDILSVSSEEWSDAYAEGQGCREEMVDRIRRCHLAATSADGEETVPPTTVASCHSVSFLAPPREGATHDEILRRHRNAESFAFKQHPLAVAAVRADNASSTVRLPNKAVTIPQPKLGFPVCDLGLLPGGQRPGSGKYVLGFFAWPKKGKLVIPLSARSKSSAASYFSIVDVIEPVFKVDEKLTDGTSDDLMFAFSAFSYWDPPQASEWSLEVVFSYAKVDTESGDIRLGQKTVAATKAKFDSMIKLSSSCFMKVFDASTWNTNTLDVRCKPYGELKNIGLLKNVGGVGFSRTDALRRATFAEKMRKNEYNKQCNDPLSSYLQALCSLSPAQKKGVSSERRTIRSTVTQKQWSMCFVRGRWGRIGILRSIASCIDVNQSKKHRNFRNAFLAYMTTNHREVKEFDAFLFELTALDCTERKTMCRLGGWMSCFRKGDGCGVEMSKAIYACVDSRVFRGMRYDENDPPNVDVFLAQGEYF
ncbi:Hypothetical protein, putative [Bodo saltans]|uniref:Uncharacterized protein n=1 Tax=Bodo saltans TaxID=75058 RepID=A0A0S4IS09_BODSA|nr:Hypothetical protein, putative [Bodo saltans]|eukprot:CUF16684.1 Hypothetical protein, putative [Bodo saltans]